MPALPIDTVLRRLLELEGIRTNEKVQLNHYPNPEGTCEIHTWGDFLSSLDRPGTYQILLSNPIIDRLDKEPFPIEFVAVHTDHKKLIWSAARIQTTGVEYIWPETGSCITRGQEIALRIGNALENASKREKIEELL